MQRTMNTNGASKSTRKQAKIFLLSGSKHEIFKKKIKTDENILAGSQRTFAGLLFSALF